MVAIQILFLVWLALHASLLISARDPTRFKPRPKTALQELEEVAPIMAGSRREWSKMNRDAMEDWERRFDPERENKRRRDALYGYIPPPQPTLSPFEAWLQRNPHEQYGNEYTRYRRYENRQRRV